jgi:thiamine-monophosphate kinase
MTDAHRPHQAMGPGGEFDTIRLLMERWGDIAVDIGDDAAVLPVVEHHEHREHRVRVVSVDACVEGAHFLRPWITAREVGVRAAAAALSDVAAMGAHADALLVAFAVPDAWRAELGDIADGIAHVVRRAGARIMGGNLTRAEQFSITTTVIGSAVRPVARRGALPGDVLVVTGRLGGPGEAIRAWYQGLPPAAWARERFASPLPRLAEGQALAEAGARAMLDVSDGVVADARHMAAASGVRLQINAQLVPVGPGILVEQALTSGEEYELLAALPPAVVEGLLTTWPQRFGVPLTVIGVVEGHDRDGAVDVVFASDERADGHARTVAANSESTNSTSRVEKFSGHDHFTG